MALPRRADQLDQHGADDATTTAVDVGDVPVSRPRATPVTRDVADAVAHQGQPALDEVGADAGCGEAVTAAAMTARMHERREQQVPHQRSPSSGACIGGQQSADVVVVRGGARGRRRPGSWSGGPS